MLAFNTSEGGTNGTTVSTSNSGLSSGNAWGAVNIGTGASVKFSNTQVAHDSMAVHCTTGATSTNASMQWNSGTIQTNTTLYSRAYYYFNTSPPTISRLLQFNLGSTSAGGVGVSGGKFTITDSTSTVLQTSTTSVPLNQWFRLELMIVQDPSAGIVECRIFTSPDSTTITETITATGANTLSSPLNNAFFGLSSTAANVDLYVDEMHVQDTGYPGPYVPINRLRQNSAEGQASGTTLVTSNSAGSSGDGFDLITLTGSGVATFSNAQAAHDSQSYFINCPTAADSVTIGMATGYDSPSAAARFYIYLTSFAGGFVDLLQMRTSGGPAVKFQLGTSGSIKSVDNSSNSHAYATTMSLNTWYRFELQIVNGTSATNGAYTGSIFLGDSTTALEVYSTTTADTDTVPYTNIRFGKMGTVATYAGYIDDIAFIKGRADLIGPAFGSPSVAWL